MQRTLNKSLAVRFPVLYPGQLSHVVVHVYDHITYITPSADEVTSFWMPIDDVLGVARICEFIAAGWKVVAEPVAEDNIDIAIPRFNAEAVSQLLDLHVDQVLE